MNIKSFKINDLNTLTKITLTKSEAIAVCSPKKYGVKKALLRQLVNKLMEIDDINKVVNSDE